MFERLQKPFLTVETGEAYQPVRICFLVSNKNKVLETIRSIQCLIQKSDSSSAWDWCWMNECSALPFNSLSSNDIDPSAVVIGTLHLEDDQHLFLHVPSFKRACLATSFFIQHLNNEDARLDHADFINKVYPMSEQIAHGFSELFDDHELEHLTDLRLKDYKRINALCENAETAEEALKILHEYTHQQAEKPLPTTERYTFPTHEMDPEMLSLSFYIFLRGRELVAIRRWFGESTFSLAKAMDETIEQVFGNLELDSLS